MSAAKCAPENLAPGQSPDDWFDIIGRGAAQQAKALCAGCPLTSACLTYALREGIPDGVFGGVSANDRKRLLKQAGDGRRRKDHMAAYDREVGALLARFRDGKMNAA